MSRLSVPRALPRSEALSVAHWLMWEDEQSRWEAEVLLELTRVRQTSALHLQLGGRL
jgi:hypothetical protein